MAGNASTNQERLSLEAERDEVKADSDHYAARTTVNFCVSGGLAICIIPVQIVF